MLSEARHLSAASQITGVIKDRECTAFFSFSRS